MALLRIASTISFWHQTAQKRQKSLVGRLDTLKQQFGIHSAAADLSEPCNECTVLLDEMLTVSDMPFSFSDMHEDQVTRHRKPKTVGQLQGFLRQLDVLPIVI